MPKLMHATRRGPKQFILVDGAKLELDADGCVEATLEQAAKLLQGSQWRDPEHWSQRQVAVAAPPPAVPGGAGRRARTPQELRSAAEAEGLIQESPAPVTETLLPEGAEELPAEGSLDEDETTSIEVSDRMTKAELLNAAARAGLQLDGKLNKAQILEAIEQHANQ